VPKNIHLVSFNGTWVNTNNFIPVLWPSAKTYYEKYGKNPKKYNWVLPIIEYYDDIEKIKNEIRKNPPDIFGVSLYVWNFEFSLEVCQWVKTEFPNCIIITGGPHQYFKHHNDWFVNHNFIDASLPSEVYGEIAIADILNNLKDDNKINWNKVEQIVYPSRDRSMILRSPKATYKLDFKWDYSAFNEQKPSIDQYVDHFKNINPDGYFHCKIETTRGCPYECTFCDWGGGVGTKVIIKDLKFVKQDIDALTFYGLASIYICDANFGINGDRDVAIVQYLADKKKQSGNEFPFVQYGGYAKTNRHFDYLKKIFIIEAENQMSYVYKISQQTFDHEILDNIKRTDLRSNEHWELSKYLRDNHNYESTVELILGLPGMTLEKWYNEFNKPYEENVFARVYEWHLLPEAEAYDKSYREKFGILTSRKKINDNKWSVPSEVVVGSNTCSRVDYKNMMIIYSIYTLFMQSGIYKNCIEELIQKNKIKFSNFLKMFYTEVYPLLKKKSDGSLDHFENHLDVFVSDTINKAEMIIEWNNIEKYKVIIWSYLIFDFFKNFEKYEEIINNWFKDKLVSDKKIFKDSVLIISEQKMGAKKWQGLHMIKYDNFYEINDLILDLDRSVQFVYGNILIANKSILGL
jgi:putative methyltransferase